MRDYTQPHPDAIFRDEPTRFIEVYCNKPKHGRPRVSYHSEPIHLGDLNETLDCTAEMVTLHTLALFIIKPKKL